MQNARSLHILSLGAGVQSSTLALMAARGVVTPMPDAAIFADTGDEPPTVYTWLDYLTPLLPFPVYRVGRRRLSEEVLTLRERRNGTGSYVRLAIPAFVLKPNEAGDLKPSILTRGCTRDYKIRPIVTKARALKRAAKAQQVVQWYGISVDEADRMKDPPEHDFVGRWPLIEFGMSRDDCLTWMREQGFPEPPRSSCVYCPFHSDDEWRRLKTTEPDAFAAAVQFERDLHQQLGKATKPTSKHGLLFLHDTCVPLDQVEFGDRPGKFSNECSGRCRT